MKKDFPCRAWMTKLALRREDFSPSEWRIFTTHIRTCSVCATRRAEYGVLVTELQMLPSPPKPPPSFFSLCQEVRQEEEVLELCTLEQCEDSPQVLECVWQSEEPLAREHKTSALLPSYEADLVACEQVLILYPHEVLYLLEKAQLLFALQRYEEVLAVTAQFLREQMRNTEGWRLKAQSLSLLGRHQEAVNVCNSALEFDIHTIEIWKIKARSLLLLERYKEALRTCDHASERDAGDAELWQMKAGVLFFLDREKEAQEENEPLLQLDLNYVVDFHSIDMWVDRINILCLEERWRYEEALKACNRALQLDPKRKLAWEIKGRTLMALGCFEEALDTLQSCISLDPSDAEEWRFLGYLFKRLDQDEYAQEAFKKAEEIDPNREDVWGLRTASFFL